MNLSDLFGGGGGTTSVSPIARTYTDDNRNIRISTGPTLYYGLFVQNSGSSTNATSTNVLVYSGEITIANPGAWNETITLVGNAAQLDRASDYYGGASGFRIVRDSQKNVPVYCPNGLTLYRTITWGIATVFYREV
jgi:hypothetical protein